MVSELLIGLAIGSIIGAVFGFALCCIFTVGKR